MKTVVITGATSGIGFAAAKALAAAGYKVIGVGRSPENCVKAKDALLGAVPDANIEYFTGNLSVQSEVNAVAEQINRHLKENGDTLWALINNAGGVRNWYTTTLDGYELQFALNHLAAFLLTHRLWDALQQSGGRVIMTGSNSHKKMRMHWSDVMYKKRYSCLMAYKQSKLCNMLFAKELNRRFQSVRAYVVDPGLVNTDIGNKQTKGIVNAFWSLRKRYGVSPEVVAQTYVYLCTATPPPEGLYYHDCRKKAYSPYVDKEREAERLFELSEKLCGIQFGEEGKI